MVVISFALGPFSFRCLSAAAESWLSSLQLWQGNPDVVSITSHVLLIVQVNLILRPIGYQLDHAVGTEPHVLSMCDFVYLLPVVPDELSMSPQEFLRFIGPHQFPDAAPIQMWLESQREWVKGSHPVM